MALTSTQKKQLGEVSKSLSRIRSSLTSLTPAQKKQFEGSDTAKKLSGALSSGKKTVSRLREEKTIKAPDIGEKPLDIPEVTPLDPGDVAVTNLAGLTSDNLGIVDGRLSPIQAQIDTEQGVRDKIQEDRLDSIRDAELPSGEDVQRRLERETGIRDLRQQEANQAAQLNSIIAQRDANVLRVTGQGRGIPEAIIGGQQAQINKEAAIQALPLQAQLAATQGNIALAQDHINTWGKILMQDAQNEYNKEIMMADAVYEYADKRQQGIIDDLKAQKAQQLANSKELTQFKTNALTQALGQGAPASVASAIQNAETQEEVAVALGIYGGDVLGRRLQMAQLDKIGYENQILAAKGLETDLPGGLTPDEIKDIDNSPQGKKLLAAADLKLKLNAYDNLVDKYGIEVIGSNRAVLDNAYNELLLSYKEAANLGVLAGPDMDIINSAIRQATPGVGGALANLATLGGQGRKLRANLDQAQKTMNEAAELALDQLYARNPRYQGTAYVESILAPFGDEIITTGEMADMEALLREMEFEAATVANPNQQTI